MPAVISSDRAVAIAIDAAQHDAYRAHAFSTPYVKSAVHQPQQGRWVVSLLSDDPSNHVLSVQYMTVILDDRSGEVLVTDAGGGS